MRKRIERSVQPLEAEPTWQRGRAAVSDYDLDHHRAAAKSLTPAAVLVPLVERDSGHTVLLTQRTDHLHDHAGQVSFPGGRRDPGDESPVRTALRETEEEIGLAPEYIEIAGYLDLYETGTGFLVTPVVGFIRPGFTLEPDRFEVADVFEVPLEFLIDPANRQRQSMYWKGAHRTYYVFEYEDRFIWGATAGMLTNLAGRLGREAG